MKQYLTIYERVLLLLYYCLRLAFRLLPTRKHAFPRTVQSSEHPQAYTRLLDSLRGQTVEIRDVENLFPGWPVTISPHLERLRELADKKLEELVSNGERLEKFKDSDFALCAAMWSPRADFDNLVVLLFVLIWLFTWDDDIEENGGSVYGSLDAAQIRREETLQYVTYSLGFKVPESYNVPTSALVVGFESIGNSLCKAFTVEQRQRFLHNTKVYIKASRVEQELRLCGTVPTMEQYWGYRTDTSAVDVTTTLTELLTKANMPQYVFDDADMKHVWRETNIMISATNDMFSVKKEMRNGQIDNLIPLLCFNKKIQAQEAMDEVDTMVRSARAKFDAAAERLTSRYAEDTVVGKQVHDFIEDCKYNTTGNLMFSLVSKRYGLANSRRGDDLVFTL